MMSGAACAKIKICLCYAAAREADAEAERVKLYQEGFDQALEALTGVVWNDVDPWLRKLVRELREKAPRDQWRAFLRDLRDANSVAAQKFRGDGDVE